MKQIKIKKPYSLNFKFVFWGLVLLVIGSLFFAFCYRTRDAFSYSLCLNVFSGSATGLLLVLLTNLKVINKRQIHEVLDEIEYLYGKTNEYYFGQNNATYLLFKTDNFDYSEFLKHAYDGINAMYLIFDKILMTKLPNNLVVYYSIREKYNIKQNHSDLYMLKEHVTNLLSSLLNSNNSNNLNHQNAMKIHEELIKYLRINEEIFGFLYTYRKLLMEDISGIDNSVF